MVKFMEGLGDVPRFGDVNVVADEVPFKSHIAVKDTSGIGGDGV